MKIKLNKDLQSELTSFLSNKDIKLKTLLNILDVDKFTFSKNEINTIQKIFMENKELKEYIYIYIGEAIIEVAGGIWSIGKIKNDDAYGLPVVLGWGGKDNTPRICPDDWLWHMEHQSLRKPLGEMIYSL